MAAKNTGEEKQIKNKTKPVKKATRKKVRKQSRNKPISTLHTQIKEQKKVYNYKGEHLSTLQARFIDKYIELGNQRQAVIQAGYKVKNPDTQANQLLRIPKIADEINYRMAQLKKESIASAEEVMTYFSKVMRGEEKDQFGLEAPLSERTKAAQELAKRLVDIPNKLEGRAQATVTISLDWEGMDDAEQEGDQN